MMIRFAGRRPSPAVAIAVTALFVALGGTSYAAFSLPKNSVGTKQLRKNAVTTSKIKKGAVTASKINTSGLTVPTALHANTANSANTAGTAASATNAGHAGTADTATNGTAVAYAHVTTNGSNGTLDGPNSKNVTLVSGLGDTYCLDVSVPVRNVVGTVDANAAGANGFVEAIMRGQGDPSTIDSNCPSNANVLLFTLGFSGSGTLQEKALGFWVTFN